MKRRYFIIDLPNENVIHALNVRLGETVSSIYNADSTKVFVKTTEDFITNSSRPFNTIFPPALSTEYTLDEVRVIVNEWYPSEEL